MSQFDVYENPNPKARGAYPFVVALQSDQAGIANTCVVAPTVPFSASRGAVGRLTPIVEVKGVRHVLQVPQLASLNARDLKRSFENVRAFRSEIILALDYLFVGF
jgi:toxin CcdB